MGKIRRGKRNGAFAARFIIRWRNADGMWMEHLWAVKDCTPAQYNHAAFRFGVPEGTPIECICRFTGIVRFGTSLDPKKSHLAALREYKRRRAEGAVPMAALGRDD